MKEGEPWDRGVEIDERLGERRLGGADAHQVGGRQPPQLPPKGDCHVERAVERATRDHPMGPVVVQGDSMLTTRQLTGRWGCRSPALLALFEDCCKLAKLLVASGVDVRVEHIYREYNTVADALSNEAVDRGHESGPSPEWCEV